MYQVWQQKGAMSARELGRPHTALSRRASPVVRDDDHRKGHGDDAQAGEQRDEARLHSRCVWARFVLRVARGQAVLPTAAVVHSVVQDSALASLP